MNKLDELMELNKSVDTIINSAMEDNKKTEADNPAQNGKQALKQNGLLQYNQRCGERDCHSPNLSTSKEHIDTRQERGRQKESLITEAIRNGKNLVFS